MPELTNIQSLDTLLSYITIEGIFLFCVAYFFVIWIAIIIWVVKDISNRTNSIFLQILSILIVVLFTPLGVFLYLLIRPGRTIFEKYYEEIEENLDILADMVEKRSGGSIIEETNCPHCEYVIQTDFIVCPNCKEKLRCECKSCHKEIRENWSICPYCGEKQKDKKKKKK